jgi:alpha-beta hydrolase superfamily lysophospholipase
MLSSDNLKLLAHGLADQGIASLRVDKRGVARSRAGAPREEDLRFDTYVKDAASWLGLLRSQARVSRVFLLGHSEGALVATLAAQSGHSAGLILLAGASEPAARLIERQLAAGGMPAGLQDQSRRIAAALERGVPVCCVPPELGALYRESVRGYLMSWLPLDPARELSTVTVPVLVVQGTTDLQIDVEDARRLAAARPGSTLQLIENMNHVLKEASPARAENLATYNAPQLPLAPPLVPAIAAFVRLH